MNQPENQPTSQDQDQQDTALLRRYRDGDRAAFDALYQRIAHRLFAFALQLTKGRRADAEDLVQETFIAAYRGIGGFRGGSRVIVWLLGIMARRNRDRNRRPLPATFPIDEKTEQSSATVAPVEDTALSSILLQDAVAQLDDRLREAFLLVVAQGLTHKEAATVLDAPVGTVKWRVAEAIRRLRATLTDTTLPDTTREIQGRNDESEHLLKIRS